MEHHYVKLKSGMNIHYLEQGSSIHPTVVLLHGYPTSCLLWRHCMSAFSEKFHVLAPDLPGHGRSDKPVDVYYDLDFLTHFLVDYYDALGLERPDLVAHDLGGMAALGFVTRFPERVRRFVIMDTAPYVEWPFKMKKMIQGLKKKWMARLTLRPGIFKQALKRSLFYDADKVDDQTVDIFLKPWNESPDGFRSFQQIIHPPPEHLTVEPEKLRRISAPTLVLWAENDLLFPLSVARQLTRDIPGATLVTIPECGHFLPEEQPKQVLIHSMDFLNTPI